MSQSTTTDARAVVGAYFDALDRGDLDALIASFAPDATWEVPGDLPVSGTYTGGHEIIETFLAKMLGRLDPDAPVGRELTALFATGDVAVAEVDRACDRPQRRALRERLLRRLRDQRRKAHRRPRVLRHPADGRGAVRPVAGGVVAKGAAFHVDS